MIRPVKSGKIDRTSDLTFFPTDDFAEKKSLPFMVSFIFQNLAEKNSSGALISFSLIKQNLRLKITILSLFHRKILNKKGVNTNLRILFPSFQRKMAFHFIIMNPPGPT